MGALTQGILVALIVGACAASALWTLLPVTARRALANRALRLPLPPLLATPLRRAAKPAAGCGCDGCDHAAPRPAPSVPQRVTFHPRPPR